MKNIKIAGAGLFLALSIGPCFAQTATVSDLWFIRGNWKAELGAHEYVKEQWKRTDEKTLVGESEFIEENLEARKVLTKESMTISETENGLVLRIRHTDKHGESWEESSEAGDMKLVEYDLTHAVFDNRKKIDRVKITYTWIDQNHMTARVEVTEAKKPKILEFRYRKEIELYSKKVKRRNPQSSSPGLLNQFDEEWYESEDPKPPEGYIW